MSISLSRREFLEMSALSAAGLALENVMSGSEANSSVIPAGDESQLVDHRPFQARLVFSVDQDWQFFRPLEDAHLASVKQAVRNEALLPVDAEWEPATLPHTVRLEPVDVSGCLNYQGVCWYKRSLHVKPEWRDRILYLNFQGAMQVADVWLNGNHLTTHYGGYTPFTIDISKAVQFDSENVLLVRLDNSDNPEVPPGKPQKMLDFTYFGGLYRSVDLQVLQTVHITDPILADKVAGGGIFVTFPAVSRAEATVRVQTDVANESTESENCAVTQTLIDPDGKIVASDTQNVVVAAGTSNAAVQSMQVPSPSLWHPENPQLYWLHTTIAAQGRMLDDQYTRIGIRSIEFKKGRGLLINGQPFVSIGANRHQDHPYVGYALSSSAHFCDAYKLREAGFTSYRSHYPQDPSFMDACDKLGILAVVSNPGWQFVGNDIFKRRVYQDAREMIRRDRNHPCVVLWEAQLNESDNSSLAAELYQIVHEEFPGPGCYTAGDPIHKPVAGFNGWDIHYDSYQKMDSSGPFWITDSSRPSWIREWGDQVNNWTDQQGRARVARQWGEMPMLVQASAHMLRMNRVYETEVMPAGADLWAGLDYYRGYHHQPFLGGPLDLFRLPKFGYHMFQSQRPPETKAGRVGSGPMVFIANFASFASPSVVTVFSNCEQVRLVRNGETVAVQLPDSGYHIPHPPFTFHVGNFIDSQTMLFSTGVAPLSIEIGELRAEGLIGGEIVATHTVHTPGVPDHVDLQLDTCGLDPVANGGDWFRVYAYIRDARNTTYPYSNAEVIFSVEGAARLIDSPRIHANPVRAEAGIATALVQTTGEAGSIVVRATSPGLKEGTVQCKSTPEWQLTLR